MRESFVGNYAVETNLKNKILSNTVVLLFTLHIQLLLQVCRSSISDRLNLSEISATYSGSLFWKKGKKNNCLHILKIITNAEIQPENQTSLSMSTESSEALTITGISQLENSWGGGNMQSESVQWPKCADDSYKAEQAVTRLYSKYSHYVNWYGKLTNCRKLHIGMQTILNAKLPTAPTTV